MTKKLGAMILIALAGFFVVTSCVQLATCVVSADVRIVQRTGDLSETVYAFYAANGLLEKVVVYRGGCARIPFVVPFTYSGMDLEVVGLRYGLS